MGNRVLRDMASGAVAGVLISAAAWLTVWAFAAVFDVEVNSNRAQCERDNPGRRCSIVWGPTK